MAEKEYIDRVALIAEMDSEAPVNWTNSDTEAQEEWDYLRYRDMILAQPAADVEEVRHGEWHYNPDGMDWGLGAWQCSLCHCKNDNLPMQRNIKPLQWAGSKYCPNCGAKMDGGTK